jgi:hypothetical protein
VAVIVKDKSKAKAVVAKNKASATVAVSEEEHFARICAAIEVKEEAIFKKHCPQGTFYTGHGTAALARKNFELHWAQLPNIAVRQVYACDMLELNDSGQPHNAPLDLRLKYHLNDKYREIHSYTQKQYMSHQSIGQFRDFNVMLRERLIGDGARSGNLDKYKRTPTTVQEYENYNKSKAK